MELSGSGKTRRIAFLGSAVLMFGLARVGVAEAHVFREPAAGCYDYRSTAGNEGTDYYTADGHDCPFFDTDNFTHAQVTGLYVDFANYDNTRYSSAKACLQPPNSTAFFCDSAVNGTTTYGVQTINLYGNYGDWANSSYANYYTYVSFNALASGSQDSHALFGITAY
jgi:hypothetical protein